MCFGLPKFPDALLQPLCDSQHCVLPPMSLFSPDKKKAPFLLWSLEGKGVFNIKY